MLLAACATPAPTTLIDGAPYWSGRLALTVDSDPPQSFSAGFDLRGTPQTGELQLNSPLGTALATVRWTPEGAELLQGDTITRRPTLDTLTTELGGQALPVAALFAWLRGHGAEINGWQADLSRQASGRIVARRTQPLPTAELRIVLQP
ncbi:lipoprotein insertase outer membrane protein LolB [Hydrogenophaga sp.]|uniref:lipoprotein insertase outer membrane protein LolB n=1 Tax=Hydrogenophaga sp. TaxID=1904254 RepID=UPI003BB0416F